MRATLLHLFGVLLIVGYPCTAIFSNSDTYCKYNDDPIIIEEDSHRETIELSGAANLLTFCNLKVGETYELSGFSPTDISCMFLFKHADVLLPDGAEGENQTHLSFKALSSCIDVEVLNNNCTRSNANYPVYLSAVCTSCEVEYGPSLLPPNLETDPNWTAEDLISDVFIGGDCFDITGVNQLGSGAGVGFFSSGDVIGMEKGIILSTGNVTSAPGPGSSGNASAATNPNNSDADLLQLSGNGAMNDCNGIEFDFIPTLSDLTFKYVFASEEYCEFVGAFNDAFGFFISGPGISGPFANGAENIALVPGGGGTNVAINTVNHNTNSAYFNPNDNSCGGTTNTADIRYDGFTQIFTASIQGLVECEVYHIKLIVGDANDRAYDTAVFLEGASFDAGGEINADATVPNTGGNVAIEECQDGQFIFTRSAVDLSLPLTINFTIGGTATAGVDYVAFPPSVTIGANTNTFVLNVDILPDAIIEGAETITITLEDDACSCLGQVTELIIEDYVPIDIPDEVIDVCGQVSTTLGPDITGGAPNFTYQWGGNQTTPTITVSPANTTMYFVTVTDQCGSTGEASFTVNVTTAPTATLSGSSSLCVEDPNPSATLTVTFTGLGPWDLTYNYNGSPTTITGIMDNPFDLIVDAAGSYTLSTVENSACPGTVSGSATVNVVDVELTTVPMNVLCNGGSTGSIDLTAIGGDPVYNYSWDTGPVSEDLNNITVGTYNVTVTDSNGCSETTSVQITEPPVLNSNLVEVASVNCNGDATGAIDLTASGGSPGYFYVWSNGNPDEDISQLTAGTYTVTVTDINSCTSVSSITLTEPDAMFADVQVLQNVSCNGGNNGAVDLTVSGGSFPFFYTWSNGGGSNEDPNDLMAGVYTVTVTDVFGCTTVGGVSVSEPLPILAQADEVQGVTCTNPNGGWADLVVAGGTPGYTYLWDNGSVDQDPTNLDAGPHSVVITDALGCTETADVTITSDMELPSVDIEVTGLISCINGTVTLDGSGSSGNGTLSYEWQNAGGTVIGMSESTTVNSAGQYTLIVTNDSNGCTASSSAMVDENAEVPIADATVSGILDCINISATLDGSGSTGNGPLEYEWLDNGGTPIDDQVSTDVVASGTYTLIITDSDNGCTSSTTVIVDQDIAAPTPDAQSSGLITCIDGTVTLSGSGSTGSGTLDYEWFDDTNTSLGDTETVDVSQPGTFILVITDSQNGCTAETTVDVDQNNDIPVPDAQVSGILTCIDLMATLDGSNSTGTGTLSYEWLDAGGSSVGVTAQVETNVAGEYTLIITDDVNGCTSETTVEVMEDVEDPVAVADVNDGLTCLTTVVTVDGSGSSANGTVNYEWLDPGLASIGNTPQVDVSAPGIYILIITDDVNGCTAETTIEVLESIDAPTPDAIADGILTCDNVDVTLDGSGSNGTGSLDYEWFNPGGTSIGQNDNVAVTAPGTYTLIITDSQNGCTAETSLIIDQNIDTPSADAGPGTSLTCADTQVTLDGANSTTGNNISYEWVNSGNVNVGNTISVDVTETGTYTLIVTNDDNGCTASSTVDVTPDANLPTADAGLGASLTCVVDQVTLDGSGSSSGGNISYQWFDPANSPISPSLIIDVNQIGTYTLVVTNTDNGCSASSSVEVGEDMAAPSADAGNVQFITCTETQVTLDGSGSTGNSLSYQWLNCQWY